MIKMKIGKMGNRGQAWGIDLMAAFMIFMFGILIFYFYTLNEPGESNKNTEAMFYDGKIIASSILSEGYPADWNSSNAVRIGILSGNKINETKLERFHDLATEDYGKTKNLFNTRFNYYFYLDGNMTLSSGEIKGIGAEPTSTKNLIKTTRFTIYKNKPATVYLNIWE